MMSIANILAATDLSAPARHAVARAFLVAGERGAELNLMHVIDQGALNGLRRLVGVESPALEERILDEAREAMAQLAADYGAGLDVAAGVRLVAGSVLRTLLDEADGMDADLIVLGARGENYMRTLLLGTTAERLLKCGRYPMLVVKLIPRGPYRRVLVPLDFSAVSVPALRAAQAIAPGADLIALHAFEAPFESKLRYAGVEEDVIQAYRTETMNESRIKLRELTGQAGLRPEDVNFSVIHGDATRAILTREQEEDCDLIVMGKHGQGMIEELLLGSVTKHVLSQSVCDVLVVGG